MSTIHNLLLELSKLYRLVIRYENVRVSPRMLKTTAVTKGVHEQLKANLPLADQSELLGDYPLIRKVSRAVIILCSENRRLHNLCLAHPGNNSIK